MKNPDYQLISSQLELDAICEKARLAGIIGLDTEFLREKVYFPKLCLIQISIEQQYYLLDTLAFDQQSIKPLIEVLSDSHIIKLIHSCSQDIEVLFYAFDVQLENVFDTQLAAAFCDYEAQVSYANLVAEVSGVQLDKSQTRTDWSKRPLSKEQLFYAVNDVVYLQDLYETFSAMLIDQDKQHWFEQANLEIIQNVIDAAQPEYAIKRINGASLTVPSQHLLVFLADMREDAARKANKPRTWLLKDADMYELAGAMPSNESQLDKLKPTRFIIRNKQAIFTKVKELSEHQLERLWQPYEPLSPDQKQQVKILSQKLTELANNKGVARGVIANRKDIEVHVSGKGARFEQGWRYEFMGDWYQS